ncbi:hypothetical protein PG993_006961 [Apiospora rasikravindrae]|uniref:Uncharacterized protein n=1 Tax=Apiospora rasikravindrae TaxID=990691 RepID=A0ABR1SW53_9PEZI
MQKGPSDAFAPLLQGVGVQRSDDAVVCGLRRARELGLLLGVGAPNCDHGEQEGDTLQQRAGVGIGIGVGIDVVAGVGAGHSLWVGDGAELGIQNALANLLGQHVGIAELMLDYEIHGEELCVAEAVGRGAQPMVQVDAIDGVARVARVV